ncbi:MAG: cell division protein ZapA [Gemmatimonadaceae bacterium]
MAGKKTVVRVTIVDEEYSIRSDETTEHTRRVADHVDRTIRSVLGTGSVIEVQKAAILAALQITDELFKEREASKDLAASMRSLCADVRRWLPPAKRGDKAAKA